VTFRFVHAADLHLAFPFAGLGDVPPAWSERLARAPFDAFERVVDLALEREVDALVVAGDVYHAADRTLAAQLAFRDGCARAAGGGVAVYVAHGNHDPLSGWQAGLEMPDGVHVFGPTPEAVPLATRSGEPMGVAVGWSYPRAAVPASPVAAYAEVAADAVEAGARFVLGVLHTECGGGAAALCPYAPTTPAELAAAPVDYWALGHVHGFRRVLDHPGGPVAVYPGTPQGRHPGETGPRGCCLVTVHDLAPSSRRIEVERVPCDAVRWHRSELDLSGVETLDALLERLEAERETVHAGHGRPVLWCLELTGRTILHDTLARLDLSRDLAGPLQDERPDQRDAVWIARLVDRTARPLDPAALERRRDLVGDLARETARLGRLPGDELASALRALLDERPEAPKIAADLDRLCDDPAAAQGLLPAARELAFDLLLASEDGDVRGAS
jgi:DNA repair exonuclease SbcCD nuclease subunit